MHPRLVAQEFHKKQKIDDEPSLTDLTISNSSTIPMTAGDGPLDTLQVDPKIQERKEERLKAIETWIAAEKDTSKKLSMVLADQEAEFRRDFNTDVILAKQDRCLKKLEMLTKMFSETVYTEGKLYGNEPAIEWILEFRKKWEKDGIELDQKVTEELKIQAQRLQRDFESEDTWQRAAEIGSSYSWSEIKTPPPNAPPPQ